MQNRDIVVINKCFAVARDLPIEKPNPKFGAIRWPAFVENGICNFMAEIRRELNEHSFYT